MIEIALVVTGILAGIVNAVAGGGILFVFPILLLAGLSPLSAAMTSTFAGWPGALMSVYGYRKDLRRVPKAYFWLAIPCAAGALVGACLLVHTPHSTFETILPWLILFAVCLFGFQPRLHRYIHRPVQLRSASPTILLALLLLPVSLYGGYFGAGFGFIVLAILGFTKLKTVYQINGMKNFLTAGISLTCAAVFAVSGDIHWHYAAFALVGSVIGGLVGSRMAHRISPHATRGFVVSAGLSVAAVLFFNMMH